MYTHIYRKFDKIIIITTNEKRKENNDSVIKFGSDKEKKNYFPRISVSFFSEGIIRIHFNLSKFI